MNVTPTPEIIARAIANTSGQEAFCVRSRSAGPCLNPLSVETDGHWCSAGAEAVACCSTTSATLPSTAMAMTITVNRFTTAGPYPTPRITSCFGRTIDAHMAPYTAQGKSVQQLLKDFEDHAMDADFGANTVEYLQAALSARAAEVQRFWAIAAAIAAAVSAVAAVVAILV